VILKKKVVLVIALIALIPLISACSPDHKYAVDKTLGVYFAVPKDWHQVSNTKLNNTLIDSGSSQALSIFQESRFLAAYSTDAQIDPTEFFKSSAPSAPIVIARVLNLSPAESDALSINSLRNRVFPILDGVGVTAGLSPEVNLLDDAYLNPKGGSGIADTYQWQNSDTEIQQIWQEMIISTNRQYLYEFMVRANVHDLKKYGSDINQIVSSYTVNGPGK
jgi:hypothetical protein